MALQTEIWVGDLAENLFPDNSFMRRSQNDDIFVENKVVHLPQSGTVPNVVRNRSTLPAVITERADADETYSMSEFTSDPSLIRDIDAIEVSYPKRQSVLYNHQMQLDRKMADYIAYIWGVSQAAQIVATTGDDRTVGIASGATGTRKKITKADILKAKAIMDRMDVPSEGRYLLLPSDMYNDLLEDMDLLSSRYMPQGNLQTGTVDKLYGFEIYTRSQVGRYNLNNVNPKDPDASDAANDNAYAIAWHPMFVRAALGGVKVYADEDKPEYYGSVFSTMARAGGHHTYTNQRGVVSIAESA